MMGHVVTVNEMHLRVPYAPMSMLIETEWRKVIIPGIQICGLPVILENKKNCLDGIITPKGCPSGVNL